MKMYIKKVTLSLLIDAFYDALSKSDIRSLLSHLVLEFGHRVRKEGIARLNAFNSIFYVFSGCIEFSRYKEKREITLKIMSVHSVNILYVKEKILNFLETNFLLLEKVNYSGKLLYMVVGTENLYSFCILSYSIAV